MYGQDVVRTRENIVDEYGSDLDALLRYLPYLEMNREKMTQKYYEGDADNKTIPVPIYDSNLLAFVKAARNSKLITRNYPYSYKKYKLQTAADELKAMKNGKLADFELYRAVLSKYIIEGQRKGVVWTKGVTDGIFTMVLSRLKVLFYDHSLEPGKIKKV